jgi:hypothetical protein
LGVDLNLLCVLLVLVLMGEKERGRLSSWKMKEAEVALRDVAGVDFLFRVEHRLFSFCKAAVIFISCGL